MSVHKSIMQFVSVVTDMMQYFQIHIINEKVNINQSEMISEGQ